MLLSDMFLMVHEVQVWIKRVGRSGPSTLFQSSSSSQKRLQSQFQL